MEHEFKKFEQEKLWPQIFTLINSQSDLKLFSKEIGTAHYKYNRYIDVTPYDRSRVKLKRINDDYINASHIEVPDANRRYILTQGPLDNTISHFWLMMWEQNSRAIVMLNRLVENEMDKCYQYWPEGGKSSSVLNLKDVDLVVRFKTSRNHQDFLTRDFVLTDKISGESREIKQFHFMVWPDFGQPDSPLSFLRLLDAVKASGGLDKYGPAVVHCSAGIGRSGTFCLIDSVLVMIETTGSTSGIDISKILIGMRQYRMGLIQTPDQLRFSYLAILTAANLLDNKSKLNNNNIISKNGKLSIGDTQNDDDNIFISSQSPVDDDDDDDDNDNDGDDEYSLRQREEKEEDERRLSEIDSEILTTNLTPISNSCSISSQDNYSNQSTMLLQRRRERDLRKQRIAEKTKIIKENMKAQEAKRANKSIWPSANELPKVAKQIGLMTCGVAVLLCLYYYAYR